MEKYWLILEPYVFVQADNEGCIIYNTLNYKYYEATDNRVVSICSELKNIQNHFVTLLSGNLLENNHVRLLIKWLKESFSGECIPLSIAPVKPFQVVPSWYLKDKGKENDKYIEGVNFEYNLRELTLYINDSCNNSCDLCQNAYKQILFCKKGKGLELDYMLIKKIVTEAENMSLRKVNIIGGNIFKHSKWDDIIKFLNAVTCEIVFYFSLKNIKDLSSLSCFLSSRFKVILLINVKDVDEIEINFIKELEKKEDLLVGFNFIVQSEEDVEFIFKNNLNIKDNSIIPYYNGRNFAFFIDNVFMARKDILTTKRSMREILRNEVFNSYFWGKLIIDVDKNIYSSFNLRSHGKVLSNMLVSSTLLELVGESSAWKLVRKKEVPCSVCRYNFLCPPISDYELSINKRNLCHIK